MGRADRKTSFHRVLLLSASVLFSLRFVGAQERKPAADAEPTLVRVEITITSEGPPEPVEIAGKQVANYRPKIVETFPSTGVVIDDKGHILTFLGYSWVDIHGRDPHVEVSGPDGKKCKGTLIGIDQSIGVAIVRCLQGDKLLKTPFCLSCEVRDGATIVTPASPEIGVSQFGRSRIVAVGRGNAPTGGKEGLQITVNRPLPGIGEPVLDTRHRVLGFVAAQNPSAAGDGAEAIIYPISQLLSSGQKVLAAGSDIRTGWLGVFVDPPETAGTAGVIISRTLPGSPAAKAGLLPQDTVLKWNGKEIRDAIHFIQMIQDTPVGSKATMEYVRQGKTLTSTTVVEGRKPEEKPSRLAFDFRNFVTFGPDLSQADAQIRALAGGIDLVQVTPQLAEFLQMSGKTGVFVSNVEANTPFFAAGILAGDVIVAIDGEPVRDPGSILNRLQSISRGGRLLLKLVRRGAEHNATVQFPK
jgi:serine protease Do